MKEKQTVSFNWGASHVYDTGLRSRELSDRVWWFIRMRWFAVLLCLAALVIILLDLAPADLDPLYFLSTAFFLILTNLFYTSLSSGFTQKAGAKRKDSDLPEKRHTNRTGIRILLIMQVITDYMALSLITYACGTIETPILILFTAHIILLTLFFPRRLSVLITFLGFFFASLPLVLEWGGFVPVVTIFDSSFKQTIISSLPRVSGIMVGLAGCYLVCWYLVSEISTSLRSREYELEQAHKMLLKQDKEKTQSTLRATHELKAPFAAIKSYVFTLRDGYCGKLPEKAQYVVGKIGVRCDRLMANITNIIFLSNLKTLILTEQKLEKLNLDKFMTSELKDAAIRGQSRGIKINSMTGKDPPAYIKAASEHLHTMISNLLENAIIYSKDGGVVEVSLEKHKGKVSLHIVDYGIGITHENIGKIFEEHFRCNNAVRHHSNGNGLGLAMVKEIVKLHKAVIHVSSDEGRGTHFVVTFDSDFSL